MTAQPAGHDPELIIQELFALSSAPTTGVVIITGNSGCGKTTLVKHLARIKALGIVHVPLDAWIYQPNSERRICYAEALASGDPKRIRFYSDPFFFFNWPKFYSDFQQFLNTGFLSLNGIFDQKTGELTANADWRIPTASRHLVVLEGQRLLHPQAIKFAHYVILLDIPRKIADERRRQRDRHRFTEQELAIRSDNYWRCWTSYRARNVANANASIGTSHLSCLHERIAILTSAPNPRRPPKPFRPTSEDINARLG